MFSSIDRLPGHDDGIARALFIHKPAQLQATCDSASNPVRSMRHDPRGLPHQFAHGCRQAAAAGCFGPPRHVRFHPSRMARRWPGCADRRRAARRDAHRDGLRPGARSRPRSQAHAVAERAPRARRCAKEPAYQSGFSKLGRELSSRQSRLAPGEVVGFFAGRLEQQLAGPAERATRAWP